MKKHLTPVNICSTASFIFILIAYFYSERNETVAEIFLLLSVLMGIILMIVTSGTRKYLDTHDDSEN